MQTLLSLFLLIVGCFTQPTEKPPTTDAEITDTAPVDDTVETVPSAELEDLTDANPVDPNTSYTWRFEFTAEEVALVNAGASYGYYGVDTHIYGYADSLTATTLDGVSSIVFEMPQVELGGQMNLCLLPCKAQLKVDLGENVDGQAMGGIRKIKFGNMLYGGPYEEFFENNFYFPSIGVKTAPQAYGWMEASYLGYLPLDYEVQEMVKEDFLDETYGVGGWEMAYEGSGDIGRGSGYFPTCQAGDCDDTVLEEIETDAKSAVANGTVLDFLDRRFLGGRERFFNFCGGEKLVGQWDGYCDAIHNYDLVIVVNPDDASQPFFDLITHSLDLTLNPDYDYSWYGLFGGSYLMQGCYSSADGCGDAYVSHLETMNENWAANVDLYEAQLDAQDAYLDSIGMQYSDYPGWLASNKTFVEERHDNVAAMIDNYRNPCATPDTGGFGGFGGGGGYDTGGGCGDIDADGDGYTARTDCDDENPEVNPGLTEVCYNEIDDDCSGLTPDDDCDLDGIPVGDDCDDMDRENTDICGDTAADTGA